MRISDVGLERRDQGLESRVSGLGVQGVRWLPM